MKEHKKNKLKKFVKDHEFALTIAGYATVAVVSVGLAYLGIRSCSHTAIKRSTEELAANDKNVAALLDVCNLVDAGTRASIVFTPDKITTVAEYIGSDAEEFFQTYPDIQPDDIIANAIVNIAKKTET